MAAEEIKDTNTTPQQKPQEEGGPLSLQLDSAASSTGSVQITNKASTNPANLGSASQGSEASEGPPSTSLPPDSSSLTPTDPSMVPPPQDPSSNSDDATNNVPVSTPAEPESSADSPPPMPSTESIEKKKYELKKRYYEVRTEVEKEPEVSALKEKAEHATTDEGKRQVLRAYYELLFTKMKKTDSAIINRCDLMEKAYLRRLEQVTLQPTIPLLPKNGDK